MFRYKVYQGVPEKERLTQIYRLYEEIFQVPSTYVEERIEKVEQLLVLCAFDGEQLVGFKIGYEEKSDEFYSWIGGVHPNYRKKGIGTELMNMQHRMLIEQGYKTVLTKTKNKWRNMLILNLRHGFDIIGTYTDSKGEPKIILRKSL